MSNTTKVGNRSASRVVYKVPELNVRRTFYPHEPLRDIDIAELELFSQQPGGRMMIKNYLYIPDEKVLKHLLNTNVPIEYWLTEDKLPGWMTSCSLEEFQDALDFAPEGIKDLIKEYAFKLPLNDYSKRQALKDQLGYDVTQALENAKAIAAEGSGTSDSGSASTVKVTSTRRSSTTSIVKPVTTTEE